MWIVVVIKDLDWLYPRCIQDLETYTKLQWSSSALILALIFHQGQNKSVLSEHILPSCLKSCLQNCPYRWRLAHVLQLQWQPLLKQTYKALVVCCSVAMVHMGMLKYTKIQFCSLFQYLLLLFLQNKIYIVMVKEDVKISFCTTTNAV